MLQPQAQSAERMAKLEKLIAESYRRRASVRRPPKTEEALRGLKERINNPALVFERHIAGGHDAKVQSES